MLHGLLVAYLFGESGGVLIVECAACTGPRADSQVFAFPICTQVRSATLAQSLDLLKLVIKALLLDLHQIGADKLALCRALAIRLFFKSHIDQVAIQLDIDLSVEALPLPLPLPAFLVEKQLLLGMLGANLLG